MKKELYEMLKKSAEADKAKALLSLELLGKYISAAKPKRWLEPTLPPTYKLCSIVL